MARTGRFGRMPRVAPDLTSTIVAMMREYEQIRERNLLNAWKEGGEFEGHRVTDGMVTKHFKAKLSSLDPSDPLYDEAKNAAEQYGFAIRNSKMELAYAQKKVGDGGMAAFYRREAGRHPQNSEAWRNMMSLSAGYSGRVAAAGRARGAANKAQLAGKIENPQSRELAYDGWKSYILELARQRGIINTSENPDTTTNPLSGQGFADLQPASLDYEHLSGLIDEFATAPQWAPARQQLTEWVRQNGWEGFDGDFTMEGVSKLRLTKMKGLHDRLDLALRKGTKTQQGKLQKAIGVTTKEGAAISAIDPMSQYEEGRVLYNKIISDPGSTPIDRANADKAWMDQLAAIHAQVTALIPANQGDGGQTSVIAGRLYAEMLGLTGDAGAAQGTATMWEEGRPATAGDKSDVSQSDNGTTADRVKQDRAQIEKLLAGNAVLTRVGADGMPTDKPGGVWGVVDQATMLSIAPPGAVSLVHGNPYGKLEINNGTDPAGKPISEQLDLGAVMTGVVAQPITVGARGLEVTGSGRPGPELKPLPGMNTDIGMVFVYDDGSRTYGYYDAQGALKYTPAPFWKTETEPGHPIGVGDNSAAGGGIQLTMTSSGTTFDPYGAERAASVPGAAGINAVFKPTDAIDGWHYDPAQNRWSADTFSSSYVAHAVASNTIDTLPPKLIAQGVASESGGDQAKAAAMLAEADKAKATAINNRFDYVPNSRLQRGNYLPDLSPDERAAMPVTAAQIDELQKFESDVSMRTAFGAGGIKDVRGRGLATVPFMSSQMGRAFPAGDLASLVKNGVANTMSDTVNKMKPSPYYNPMPYGVGTQFGIPGVPGSGTGIPPTPAFVTPPAPHAPAPSGNIGSTTPPGVLAPRPVTAPAFVTPPNTTGSGSTTTKLPPLEPPHLAVRSPTQRVPS